MSYNNIIGNTKVKEFLDKALINNTIVHSYMFIGQNGIGKSMIAKEFAKKILCENINYQEKMPEENYIAEACNKCKSCIEFSGNNNPDFMYIEPEGKTLKIEYIREMQNKVIEKPIISTKKVYIINDADTMTKEAQNCLLKTLEEPPEYIIIILIVNNESKLLNTIKSRCMKVSFEKIDDEDIEKYLRENCNVTQINDNILKMCDGSIGKCLQIKDRIQDYVQLEKIFLNINHKSIISVVNSAEILYKNKDYVMEYLDYINVLLYKYVYTNDINSMKYINSIKIVEKAKQRLLNNGNYDMCIDYLLFNIYEEIGRI